MLLSKEQCNPPPLFGKVDDREGMEGGGEGTSAKEANGERRWLSVVALAVYGGVSVSF